MDTKTKLLADAQAFIARHKMPYTTFGKLALNDPAFLYKLPRRRWITTATEERVRRFMRDYRPPKRGRVRPSRRPQVAA